MQFITLTCCAGNNRIRVNVRNISTYETGKYQNKECTLLFIGDNPEFTRVHETPEQIDAMIRIAGGEVYGL